MNNQNPSVTQTILAAFSILLLLSTVYILNLGGVRDRATGYAVVAPEYYCYYDTMYGYCVGNCPDGEYCMEIIPGQCVCAPPPPSSTSSSTSTSIPAPPSCYFDSILWSCVGACPQGQSCVQTAPAYCECIVVYPSSTSSTSTSSTSTSSTSTSSTSTSTTIAYDCYYQEYPDCSMGTCPNGMACQPYMFPGYSYGICDCYTIDSTSSTTSTSSTSTTSTTYSPHTTSSTTTTTYPGDDYPTEPTDCGLLRYPYCDLGICGTGRYCETLNYSDGSFYCDCVENQTSTTTTTLSLYPCEMILDPSEDACTPGFCRYGRECVFVPARGSLSDRCACALPTTSTTSTTSTPTTTTSTSTSPSQTSTTQASAGTGIGQGVTTTTTLDPQGGDDGETQTVHRDDALVNITVETGQPPHTQPGGTVRVTARVNSSGRVRDLNVQLRLAGSFNEQPVQTIHLDDTLSTTVSWDVAVPEDAVVGGYDFRLDVIDPINQSRANSTSTVFVVTPTKIDFGIIDGVLPGIKKIREQTFKVIRNVFSTAYSNKTLILLTLLILIGLTYMAYSLIVRHKK